MKKLSILVGACLISLLVYNCNKDNNVLDLNKSESGLPALDRSDSDLISAYSVMGSIHNEGLDSVYSYLNNKANQSSYKAIPAFDISKAIFSFLKTKNYLVLADSLDHLYYPDSNIYKTVIASNFTTNRLQQV